MTEEEPFGGIILYFISRHYSVSTTFNRELAVGMDCDLLSVLPTVCFAAECTPSYRLALWVVVITSDLSIVADFS